MLLIDTNGIVINSRINRALRPTIERGHMKAVHGIIVHQTGGATAQSAFESYKNPSANGAHFLIDRDGTILSNCLSL
jgi:N-acetyl-anhydromuramyl-L-alanine amidase AmpD